MISVNESRAAYINIRIFFVIFTYFMQKGKENIVIEE